jgi:hypothetical protein
MSVALYRAANEPRGYLEPASQRVLLLAFNTTIGSAPQHRFGRTKPKYPINSTVLVRACSAERRLG